MLVKFCYKAIYFSIFAIALISCRGNSGLEVQNNLDGVLPPDVISDIKRSAEYYYMQLPGDQNQDAPRDIQTFNFATLLETKLEIELKLYDVTNLTDAQLAEHKKNGTQHLLLTQEAVNATVLIRNKRENKAIFSGRTNALGRLNAKILLQPAFDNCTLEIYRPHAAKKTFEIPKVSELSTVSRTISLVQTNESSALAPLSDQDNDGIADVYDAFPADPLRTFQYDVPVVRFLTVAFEDNFPNLGDGDFNDFIARYYVSKITNAENNVVELQGVAEAVARVAGYDHRFGIVIHFPGATGQVSIEYKNHTGITTSTSAYAATDKANLVIFERTKQAFTRLNGGSGVDNGYNDRPRSNGHSTNFSIVFSAPVAPNLIDDAPYDPYIFVHNTGYDIHLLGKPALPGSNNPAGTEGFRDANGYPRGLLVPIDWAHPIEATFIENAYPRFLPWRTSFGMTDTDWYLTRVNSLVVMQDFFTQGQIRNEYTGQAVLGTNALIVHINTNKTLSFINSNQPQYAYNGTYVYNEASRQMHVDFTTVDLLDSTCTAAPCPIFATFPASLFNIDPAYNDIVMNGIFDNALNATLTATNTPLVFYRRNAFGPFDETTPGVSASEVAP